MIGEVTEYLIQKNIFEDTMVNTTSGIMGFALNPTQGCLTPRISDNKHIIRIMPILMNFFWKVSYELNSTDPV